MKFNVKKTWWAPEDVTLVKKAIRFAAGALGLKNLDLTIYLGKPNKKYFGFSGYDDANGYEIWIYPSDDKTQVALSIFHEMTHVKQQWCGELDLEYFVPRWKGRKCKAKYKNQPWEIEAHKMEVILYKEFERAGIV